MHSSTNPTPILITVPPHTLLVLCGPAASGKSTFATQRFTPTTIVSSDYCRALICDDMTNQRVNRDTFDLFHYIIHKRMFNNRFTVADSTALYPEARHRLREVASRHNYATCLLIFNISEATCHIYNRQRERIVEDHVISHHMHLLQQTLLDAPNEDWHQLHILREEDISRVQINIEGMQRI